MGKTKMPTVAFKMKTEDFHYLVRALREQMNQLIGAIEDDDAYEQLLFEHNYYLLRSWIALCETDNQNLTVKVDVLYAKAFVAYFKTAMLPVYENMLLGKVIKDLDCGLQNWEHKRKYAL